MNILEIARYMLPMTHYPFTGEVVSCPVCDERSFTAIASVDRRFKRLPSVMCDQCGLLYTNPMPTESELNYYYEKYYRFDYQLATSRPKMKHVRKRQREAATRADQLHGLLAAGARTLDFGAGSGEFVSLMLQKGFDAHGFEPGETYAKHAIEQLGSRIRCTSWQSADYRAEFDLVTSFHVLEHLREPIGALKRIVDWLRPGGKVYVEVPDMAFSLAQKGFGSLHFAHVIGFNHHNLILAAAKAGLRPLKVVTPTGIIFEKGMVDNQQALAVSGHAVTAEIVAQNSASRAYIAYQLSKVGIRRRQ